MAAMAICARGRAVHSFQMRRCWRYRHRARLLVGALTGGVDECIGLAAGSSSLSVLVLGSRNSRSRSCRCRRRVEAPSSEWGCRRSNSVSSSAVAAGGRKPAASGLGHSYESHIARQGVPSRLAKRRCPTYSHEVRRGFPWHRTAVVVVGSPSARGLAPCRACRTAHDGEGHRRAPVVGSRTAACCCVQTAAAGSAADVEGLEGSGTEVSSTGAEDVGERSKTDRWASGRVCFAVLSLVLTDESPQKPVVPVGSSSQP
jgi:hypothetical protein